VRSIRIRFARGWQDALNAKLKLAGLFFWAADGTALVIPAPADATVIVRRTRGKNGR
jgi:hypothetical protein